MSSSTTPPLLTDQSIGVPEAPKEADEMAAQQTKENPKTQEIHIFLMDERRRHQYLQYIHAVCTEVLQVLFFT
jgi:hypothetical protein